MECCQNLYLICCVHQGALLLVFGPFGDYSRYRRQMLAFCFALWTPCFLAVSFVYNPKHYWLALCFALVGATAYFFGLKSPFAAYLPLIIENSHELRSKYGALEYKKRSVDIPLRDHTGSIELPGVVEHQKIDDGTETILENSESFDSGQRTQGIGNDSGAYERSGSLSNTPFLTAPTLMSTNEELSLNFGAQLSDAPGGVSSTLEEKYQAAYQSVAARIALRESASFISGML